MTFGERLKWLRKGADLTQGALAEALGVHLQTVSKWERDISRPDLSLLGDMATALHVSLERLLGAEEGEETFTGTFDAPRFGSNLAALRKDKGELQEDLAARLLTTSDIVSKWERGVICPDMDQLVALSEHYALPLSRLYFGIGEEERTETPVEGRRRRRRSLAWLAGVAVLGISGIVCAAILPGALEKNAVYTVTAGGETYEVSEHDWFTPAAVQREGYDFIGYTDADGSLMQFPVKIGADTSYTPLFRPHDYLLDYWLNGGHFLATPPATVTVESGALPLPTPQKEGATFEGWYMAADYAGLPLTHIGYTGENVTLYARWSDESFTVRYSLDGGTLHESNPTVVTKEEETVLSEPVRSGYDFLGWYTTPTGGVRVTKVGGEGAANLTLYALWQENDGLRSVRYETAGGTMTGDNPRRVGAGEVYVLAPAERTGYDFLGWNDRSDGTGSYYSMLYGIRSDLVLYAVWSARTYTVRYELSLGTYCEGVNPNQIVYGDHVSLRPVARAGHTFVGWFTSPTGGEQIEVIDEGNLPRIATLYARFTPDVYTISLQAGEGSFEDGSHVQSRRLAFGDEAQLPVPVLAGYDFAGWFDEEGRRYERIDVTNIGNVTLTAKYRVAGLTYTIDYALQGGTMSVDNPTKVGHGQVISLAEPTRDGFLFLGWNERPDGSGKYFTATPAEQSADLTLYAVWQEIVVNGNTGNFSYERGNSSVTITGYTGPFGEHVDLVLPSFLEGLPVVRIEGLNTGTANRSLHSLTLPANLAAIGGGALRLITLARPLTLPAGVVEIGPQAFEGSVLPALLFAEGSELTSVGERAFSNAFVERAIVLPTGVHTLQSGAFRDCCVPSLVLPDTLQYVFSGALAIRQRDSNVRFKMYLPDSVKYFEGSAFATMIYTRLSREAFRVFAPNVAETNVHFDLPTVGGITLEDGGTRQVLEGAVFLLPTPEKEGKHFVGWYDDGTGEYASPYYIPEREGVVLRAVYKEASAEDGTSAATPLRLQPGQTYSLVLAPNESVYLLPAVESCLLRVTAKGGLDDCFHPFGVSYVLSDGTGGTEYSSEGYAFSYIRGTVLRLRHTDPHFYSQLTVRVERMA